MAVFETELSLPNHPGSVELVRAYVRALATLGDFATDAADALAAGAADACANVLALALGPDDPGTLVLHGTLTPADLTLALREQGFPFDPARAPTALATAGGSAAPASLGGADDAASAGGAAGTHGLAWYLTRGVVDEAHWVNLGREGMELRISKARPQRDVTAHLAADALAPFHAEAPLAPPQEYTIRLLCPDEALQVAQCIYRAWGYSYPNDDLYYPERIAHLNATGALVSIVAVDAAGEVVGHVALERPELGPIAESGAAVVNPAHRGRHLLDRMRAFLEDEGRRLGLAGVFGQPVTSHVFSQRMEESFHAAVCGVSLGISPASMQFRAIQNATAGQRESLLLYFKYLAPGSTAVVYAPVQHRAMLERLYAHLETPVEFRAPPAAPAGAGAGPGPTAEPSVEKTAAGAGEVAVRFVRAWGYGLIQVRRVGTETDAAVRQALHDLCATAGAEAVYLELPLAQPGTPSLCSAAEDAGFFFSGLGPGFAPGGDALRLQYLATDLDPERLQIASPFAQELLAYVVAERARVASASGSDRSAG
jgi:hypothetical protein